MARTKRDRPPMTELTCDTIGEIAGGQARGTIDAAINAAMRDLEDRGEDEAVRKVRIDLLFKKIGDSEVATVVQVGTAIPKYLTAKTVGRLVIGENRQVFLEYQANSPDNPYQRTIVDDDQRDE